MSHDRRLEEFGLKFIVVGCVFMAFVVLAIPVHIIFEYGFSSGPLYRRDGSIAGQVNYLLVGLMMAFVGFVIVGGVIKLALKHLRILRTQRGDPAVAKDQMPD